MVEGVFLLWVGGFLAGTAGVWGVERWALRQAILDVPNDRSSHERPTPRGGGLAVLGVILLGWGGGLWALGIAPPWSIVLGLGLVGAVSWLDDLRGVSNHVRFGIHLLAAVLVLWDLGAWEAVSLPGGIEVSLGATGGVLAMIWVVGLTNAYNFMDGIDGIAGGQAVLAGVGWAWIGAAVGAPWVMFTGGLIAVASGAFLLFNWSPARIFMGDVGSAPLGFLFAVLPLVAVVHPAALAPTRVPLAGLLLVWPFVFDAAFTFMRRLARRENVFAAHRSHLYQRLTLAGWSHRRVSTLYIVLAGLGVVASAGWLGGYAGGTTALAPGLLALGLVIGVRREEARARLAPEGLSGGSPHVPRGIGTVEGREGRRVT